MHIGKRSGAHGGSRRLARRQAAGAARTPPAPEWILAAEPFGIGDTVCALPAVRMLKAAFPGARLVLLAGRGALPLVSPLPFVDEAVAAPAKGRELRDLHRRFRARAGGCLGVLLNDGWWPSRAVLGLRPAWCCGYRERPRLDTRYHPERRVTASWDPEISERVPPETHLVDRALRAVRPVTADLHAPAAHPGVPELARAEALRELSLPPVWADAPKQERILLQPGTGLRAKRWREEGWAELARRLAGRGAVCCLTGSPAERPEAERIARAAGSASLVNLAGLSLPALAALAAESGLMVAPDCGPAHIASAVGCPTVVLMGPTRPETSAPAWGLRAIVLPEPTPAPGGTAGIAVAAVLAAVERIRSRPA